MYNLLIVDDEKRIREGMAAAVRKTNLFQVREASNGLQALEQLAQQDADALLLDISMPDMDGLDLLRNLSMRENAPLTVVISGYENFDYVREAMCHGAIDYLLKPVDGDDLRALSLRLVERLKQRDSHQRYEMQLQTYVQQHKTEIRQKLLTDILDGRITRSMLEDIHSVYGIELRGKAFCVAVLQLQRVPSAGEMDFQMTLRRVELSLDALFSRRRNFQVNLFNMENARYILVFNGERDLPMAEVDALLDEILLHCAQVTELRAYIGKGGAVNAYEQLSTSFMQANQALDHKAVFGPGVVYDIQDYQSDELAQACLLMDEIEEKLRQGQYGAVEEMVQRLFDKLLKNIDRYSSAQIRYFILRCRMLTPMILLRNGHSYSADVLTDGLRTRGSVNERELRRARDSALQLLHALRPLMNENSRTRQAELAQRLLNHIDANFADSALSVSSLSTAFGYSANYLGNLFKRAFSTSINDYINQCRVRQAQKLIGETTLHVYEVAFHVGFADQNYFSKIFKKYTGLSPREYRDQLSLQNQK